MAEGGGRVDREDGGRGGGGGGRVWGMGWVEGAQEEIGESLSGDVIGDLNGFLANEMYHITSQQPKGRHRVGVHSGGVHWRVGKVRGKPIGAKSHCHCYLRSDISTSHRIPLCTVALQHPLTNPWFLLPSTRSVVGARRTGSGGRCGLALCCDLGHRTKRGYDRTRDGNLL
jgi:hypothetical protein